MLAIGGSPARIAGGGDASLAGDATAGDLAASCAQTPNGAISSKARVVPANMRSQRGPLISDSPNLAPISEKKPGYVSKFAAARASPQTNATRHENRRKSFTILAMPIPLTESCQ